MTIGAAALRERLAEVAYIRSSIALLLTVLVSCGGQKPEVAPLPEPVAPAPVLPDPAELARDAMADSLQDRRFPNVIWIVLDACRAENLSCYGYERPTSPNIDRLAERGVVFENHFAQGLWTALSVPSYMTGRYFPASCLVYAGGDYPREPDDGECFISDVLRQNGYFALCVTDHPFIVPPSRLYKAFDQTISVPPKPGSSQAGFEALNEVFFPRFAHLHERPFFLYVHALDTHFPHKPGQGHDMWITPGYSSDYISDGKPVSKTACDFSEEDKQELRGLHDGSIHYADARIGDMLDLLEAHGLADNTIIMIGADHGDALGENGRDWGHESTYDQIMRVPLVIAGPGIPRGKRIEAFTENVDIVPTLIDLPGLETSAVPDGKSLLPLLYSEDPPPLRDYAFMRACYKYFVYDDAPTYVLRTAKYKYEYDAFADRRFLWRVPDNVADRADCLEEEPEAAAALHERVLKEYVPLWEAYLKQTTLYFHIRMTRDVLEKSIVDKEALVIGDGWMPDEASCEDNKWLFSRRTLWSASWAEETPPLALRFEVPPDRYRVFVELLVFKDLLGHEASSVYVKAEDDERFKTLRRLPLALEEKQPFFIELGVYDVLDGMLDVTLRQGQRDRWAIVRRFRLVPLTGADSWKAAVNERKERQEQLRALGYLE